jgi:hypothetical protein
MARTYEIISTQTVTTPVASITLSSIPGTYTDLIIVANGATTSGGSMFARFNGDAGSNYSTEYLYATGSTVVNSRIALGSSGIAGSRNGIGTQGGGVMQILNYSNTTTFKTMLTQQFGYDQIVWLSCGLYRGSTSAITSIVFTDESSGNFTTGFTLNLYGIKAA